MTQAEADAQIAAIQVQIAAFNADIAAWNALLLADATGATATQKDYSLDGEVFNREGWRNGLMDRIKKALECVKMLLDQIILVQQTANALNPYWLPTRQVT